ncbi:MAG: hypothetical protein Q8Q14_04730 [Gemmatimonadales bacterium]|nr:hypothetical protein [Gemmatimonadales bacterium]
MPPKRHRWTPDPDTEGAQKCKDCLLRRRASDPGDARPRWYWPVTWWWRPMRGDNRGRRRIGGRLPTCPPSPEDFEVTEVSR